MMVISPHSIESKPVTPSTSALLSTGSGEVLSVIAISYPSAPLGMTWLRDFKDDCIYIKDCSKWI